MNAATLWLAMPHRTQFDSTGYAPTNCGPASLAMIFEAYGLNGYSTDAIRGEVNRFQGTSDPDQGTSLSAVAAVAERAGLAPVNLHRRWTIKDVRDTLAKGLPIITLVRFADLPGRDGFDWYTNHYIVLSGLSGNMIIYNDSSYPQGAGRGLLISEEALMRAWANSVIPGQGVAFALNHSGAGLLSPEALALARTVRSGSLEDEQAAEADYATELILALGTPNGTLVTASGMPGTHPQLAALSPHSSHPSRSASGPGSHGGHATDLVLAGMVALAIILFAPRPRAGLAGLLTRLSPARATLAPQGVRGAKTDRA